MPIHMTFSVELFVGVMILGPLAAGFIYRVGLLTFVSWHFGEMSRGDHEARERRMEFEGHCLKVVTSLYFSMVVGVVRGLASELAPDISPFVLTIQIAAVLVGALFAWAAANRWSQPFGD